MKRIGSPLPLVALALLAAAPPQALAQAASGVLDRVAESGEFRIGYRTDARPMSFIGDDGQPSGYVVDICRRIAAEVALELGRDDISVDFVPVTVDERLEAIVNGDIDIECGSTTMTIPRMQQVDFTLLTFVTGGTVLSRVDSAVRTISDLEGKSVAVIRGTSTAQGLIDWLTENAVRADVVLAADRSTGMARLNAGEVDAFASDQIMLIGEVMGMDDPSQYALAQELFSYEPYSLMVPRNDAEFRLVANRALVQLFRSGEYNDIFDTWLGWAGIRPARMLIDLYEIQELPE